MRTIVAVCGVMIVCGLALAQEPAASPAPAAAAAAAPAAATAPSGPGLESIKIVCDGKVKSNGEAGLVFTPAGGSAKEIKVTLQKGENKSEVCKAVAKELAVKLGDEYKVEQYDDDKVKVEAKKGTFQLTLGGQSATGITLELKK
jgi:hypothetical protein